MSLDVTGYFKRHNGVPKFERIAKRVRDYYSVDFPGAELDYVLEALKATTPKDEFKDLGDPDPYDAFMETDEERQALYEEGLSRIRGSWKQAFLRKVFLGKVFHDKKYFRLRPTYVKWVRERFFPILDSVINLRGIQGDGVMGIMNQMDPGLVEAFRKTLEQQQYSPESISLMAENPAEVVDYYIEVSRSEPVAASSLSSNVETLSLETLTAGFAGYLSYSAGLEEKPLAERMPEWLRLVTPPKKFLESVYRVHDPAIMTERVAVLVQPELLATPGEDLRDASVRLMSMEETLRSVFGWSDQIALRLDPWSEETGEYYQQQGYRVVRIVRDEKDQMRDPIPQELMLLALSQAVASGQELFAINVTHYLALRGLTFEQVQTQLTDLYA